MQPYLFWCVTCLTQSEISLLKMIKPRLRTTRVEHSKPLLKQLHCTNSVSALLREIVVCCKAVLPKDDDEKRIACVVIIQFVFVTVFDTILKWTDNVWIIFRWLSSVSFANILWRTEYFSLDEAYTWCLQNEQYMAQHCPWGTQSPGTSVPPSTSNEKNDLKCRRKPSNQQKMTDFSWHKHEDDADTRNHDLQTEWGT